MLGAVLCVVSGSVFACEGSQPGGDDRRPLHLSRFAMDGQSPAVSQPRRSKAASHGPNRTRRSGRADRNAGHERRAPEPPSPPDGVRATSFARRALGVGSWAVAAGIWEASTVLFTVFLGILFGLAISSGVDQLARLRIPRGIGALLSCWRRSGCSRSLARSCFPCWRTGARDPLAASRGDAAVAIVGGPRRDHSARSPDGSLRRPRPHPTAVDAGMATHSRRPIFVAGCTGCAHDTGRTSQTGRDWQGSRAICSGSSIDVEIVVYVLLALFMRSTSRASRSCTTAD